MEKRILLSSPTMHGEEMKYIEEAFARNWIAPLGFNCDEFEKEMLRYLYGENSDGKAALAVSSCTAALHLAIKLAGVQPGDVVFCSDLTFVASANPVSYVGATQVFVDSERDTWNMDPAALEKAFAKYPQAKVVLLVHLYGVPAKMDEIRAICRKHNAVLIEDAAEALSATYHGRPCGTLGEYNTISFNGNKIITTSGGGMLICKHASARDKALFWATQARENAQWYQHEDVGYNYRMSNVVAGIVRGQYSHLEEHIAQKKAIWERYRKGLSGLPVRMNPFEENIAEPNYWLSAMLLDKEAMCLQERGDLKSRYVAEHGKSCPTEILEAISSIYAEGRPIWKPMHMQPMYKDHAFITASEDGLAVGADIFARGLCLPSDNKMTQQQQDRIIEVIGRCFE